MMICMLGQQPRGGGAVVPGDRAPGPAAAGHHAAEPRHRHREPAARSVSQGVAPAPSHPSCRLALLLPGEAVQKTVDPGQGEGLGEYVI
jgi:hypothetical protein